MTRKPEKFHMGEGSMAVWSFENSLDTDVSSELIASDRHARDARNVRFTSDSVRRRAQSALVLFPQDDSACSPWQNGKVERLFGSARHECTDQVIVFKEDHLRRILSKYASCYRAAIMRCGRTSRLARTHPARTRSSGSVILLESQYTYGKQQHTSAPCARGARRFKRTRGS